MRQLVLAGAVLSMFAGLSRGAERPSFSLEECAWNATEIVVVAHHDKGVTVQETWKGELVKGAVITVSDLPRAPLEVASWDKAAPRKTIAGERIVLFLKHADRAQSRPAETWVGVSRIGGTKVSAVWLEARTAYAIQQPENPGPAELWPVYESEENFRHETLDILAAKEALGKALLIADPGQRLQALVPMAKGAFWHQRHEAIVAIGECGPEALPVLRQLMREYGNNTPEFARAVARAALDTAGAEMTAVLQEELAFWTQVGPGLPVGWWNAPSDHQEQYRNRYCILSPALTTLKETHHAAARDGVRQLRDLWVSLPQLDDKSGLNQITEQCNMTLKALDAPATGQ